MKSIFLIIISLILLSFFSCENSKKPYDKILDENYEGLITNIYRDRNSHDVFRYDILYKDKYIEVVGDLYSKSWTYASVGDSIIKKKGESFITIKKGDGSFKTFETRIKK